MTLSLTESLMNGSDHAKVTRGLSSNSLVAVMSITPNPGHCRSPSNSPIMHGLGHAVGSSKVSNPRSDQQMLFVMLFMLSVVLPPTWQFRLVLKMKSQFVAFGNAHPHSRGLET